MSTSKISISVYNNLPSGGAKDTYNSTVKYLMHKYTISKLEEPKYHINNIFSYLYIAFIASPKNQKNLIDKKGSQLLLCYQSWITNSPHILRYFHNPSVYICHEAPRVFYDDYVIKTMSLKEKLINFIRIPIKIIDYINVKYSSAIVISNSYFSKRAIDKAYGVKSIVVHPGVEVSKYQKYIKKIKNNQVITVGSINRLKNQRFLVKVLSEIPEIIRPELICVSNGADRNYLKSLIKESKNLKVKMKILENISENKKIEELNKSIIFMYSPINEPFGLVVEEAIAVGLPIQVYKKGGGYSEVINEKNGLIMNNLNPKEWAKQYTKLQKDNRKLKNIQAYNQSYARDKFQEIDMNNQIENILFSGIK